jgi:Zn-dependent protease with chaperone function
MSFVNLAIIPSALLAWPLYFHAIDSSEESDISAGSAIETCISLTLAISGVLALHRWARSHLARNQTNTSIVKFLASKQTIEKLWLVLQPLVLAFACWPGFTNSLPFVQYSLAGRVISFVLPSLLFLLCLHGFKASRNWMAFMPFLVMTAIAVACDGTRWCMAPAEWEIDLWSVSSGSPVAVWSMVAVVLVSSIVTSLWIPSWIVWCSGAEPMNPNKINEGSISNDADDLVGAIEALWKQIVRTSPTILLWPTNCRMSNAVIVSGLFQKKLLLTDRLMLRFTPVEIELIVLHEMAHCIRRHGIVRMLPAVVTIPFFAWIMITLTGTSLMVLCSLLAIAFPLFLIATCWWTEWDADTKAIELAIKYKGLTHREACETYVHVIQKLYQDNGIRRSSWSHPSCAQRLAAIQTKYAELWASPSA